MGFRSEIDYGIGLWIEGLKHGQAVGNVPVDKSVPLRIYSYEVIGVSGVSEGVKARNAATRLALQNHTQKRRSNKPRSTCNE